MLQYLYKLGTQWSVLINQMSLHYRGSTVSMFEATSSLHRERWHGSCSIAFTLEWTMCNEPFWLKTWVLSSLHGHRFCQLLSMACIFQTGETKTCRGTHVWIVCTRGSSRFKTTSLPLLLSLYVFHTPIPLLSWYVCCVLEHPSFLPHSVGNATNLGSGWTSPKCCVPWPPPQ